MKLNIEELAREAGALEYTRSGVVRQSFSSAELEAFTRLIVDRCAEAASESLTKGRSPHGAKVAAAIRNLLGDE